MVVAVFDTDSFLTAAAIADDVCRYLTRNLAITGGLLAEKTHELGAAEAGPGVMHPQGIQTLEVLAIAKNDVGGPFTLINGPVIAHRQSSKDQIVNGIELLGDLIQQFRPMGVQLLIQQLLCLQEIRHPVEAVVLALISYPGGIQLAGQPFSSIDANLDGEREPGLNAGIHPAQHRMLPVLIDKQTLARTLH